MILQFVIHVRRLQHCDKCKEDKDWGYVQPVSANAISAKHTQGKAMMHILNVKSYNTFLKKIIVNSFFSS